MDEKMKQEFIQMLKEARGTPQEWSVIMAMVDMLEDDEEFEEMAELHKGIAEYGAFLTEKEAKRIVDGFKNFDGSRGAKWAMPSVVWETIERLGGKKSEAGKYNCWSMYVLMNMIYSDYGGVLQTLASGDVFVKAIYLMSLAWLDDPDRRWSIREFFDLE